MLPASVEPAKAPEDTTRKPTRGMKTPRELETPLARAFTVAFGPAKRFTLYYVAQASILAFWLFHGKKSRFFVQCLTFGVQDAEK